MVKSRRIEVVICLFFLLALPGGARAERFSLGSIFTAPASESSLAPGSQACAEQEICLRFLWPENNLPGGKLTELSGKVITVTAPSQPPVPIKDARLIEWRLPSGEVVAVTTIYHLGLEPAAYAVLTETKIELKGPTGAFARPAFAAPALTPPSSYRRVLTYETDAFAPPAHKPVPATGPVILYNDRLDALVVSPLDHFLVSIISPVEGEWLCGLEGEVEAIPAGTVVGALLVTGRGINDTVMKWGDLIQAWYGRQRPSAYADVGLSYLGYWTDNGGYYYYKTAPGMNYHQTLIAVRDDARARAIPYGYFQIDSWWYPKSSNRLGLLSAMSGGSLIWEPMPALFPAGLAAFRQELGLPLIAHNRWYNVESPYCRRYQCVYGTGSRRPALPIDPKFWDEIMDNAVKYGVQVYEQDWLVTQYHMIPWLRSGLTNAESWFDAMVKAAAARKLTVQLCMASPGFFLQQLNHPNVTQVRASGDYIAGLPKTLFWPAFHQTSMFAYAVGLWPFKDNFQSRTGQRIIANERWPYEEALISTLSAGLVGPSDKIGAADRDLLMRTCRQDGLLLKPDRPATPIDLMYLPNRKPWIVTTEVNHSFGKTVYLAAFNLWPERLPETGISLSELGLSGKYVIYDYRTHEVLLDSDRIEFGHMKRNRAYYYALCPILGNGMAVIGEADKFVTLARRRFTRVAFEQGKIIFDVEGVPGEEVPISVYSPKIPTQVTGAGAPAAAVEGVITVRATIPEGGQSFVVVE